MPGFDVSGRTVSRYMPRGSLRLDAVQRWLVFLRNHRDALAAMDFFVIPTVTFRILYVWFAIEHGRRRLLGFDVTDHPAAKWVIQKLRAAFPFDTARALVWSLEQAWPQPGRGSRGTGLRRCGPRAHDTLGAWRNAGDPRVARSRPSPPARCPRARGDPDPDAAMRRRR